MNLTSYELGKNKKTHINDIVDLPFGFCPINNIISVMNTLIRIE